MKKLLKKFEDAMAAVAFAEAGEFETARDIMKDHSALSEEIFSLAEAGEFETAREMLREKENILTVEKNCK